MDIRHRLDENGVPVVGGPIGSQARYFGSIAAARSTHRAGITFESTIGCWRKPGRKPCTGNVCIARREDNTIEYVCFVCGDGGFVSGWEGTCSDYSDLLALKVKGTGTFASR